MTPIWTVLFVMLWLVVAMLVFGMVVLARQIGLLHRRLPPFGARTTDVGPEIGKAAPEFRGEDLTGRPVAPAGPSALPRLLVFLSTGCASCDQLAPALRSIAKSERSKTDLIVASVDSSSSSAREFAERAGLTGITFIASSDLARAFGIDSTPYGVLIDRAGIVRSKGIVNSLEHIESLLNVPEAGFESIDSLMRHRLGVDQDSDAFVKEIDQLSHIQDEVTGAQSVGGDGA